MAQVKPKSLKILANNLHAILEKLDRRPAWLAKKSQVNPGTISRILKQEMNVTLGILEKLTDALKLEPYALLVDTGGSGGSLTRMAALYFLTGDRALLSEIDSDLQDEIQFAREHLVQAQLDATSRKER